MEEDTVSTGEDGFDNHCPGYDFQGNTEYKYSYNSLTFTMPDLSASSCSDASFAEYYIKLESW